MVNPIRDYRADVGCKRLADSVRPHVWLTRQTLFGAHKPKFRSWASAYSWLVKKESEWSVSTTPVRCFDRDHGEMGKIPGRHISGSKTWPVSVRLPLNTAKQIRSIAEMTGWSEPITVEHILTGKTPRISWMFSVEDARNPYVDLRLWPWSFSRSSWRRISDVVPQRLGRAAGLLGSAKWSRFASLPDQLALTLWVIDGIEKAPPPRMHAGRPAGVTKAATRRYWELAAKYAREHLHENVTAESLRRCYQRLKEKFPGPLEATVSANSVKAKGRADLIRELKNIPPGGVVVEDE